jgi:hypothetical protein
MRPTVSGTGGWRADAEQVVRDGQSPRVLPGERRSPRALRSDSLRGDPLGRRVFASCTSEWRPADFGRVRKARWDAVEANCRTLEGMARPAGPAGAQGAAAAGAGRGDIGSGLSRQQAGSLAYGGLRARLKKHQALIALLRRLAPLPIRRRLRHCSSPVRTARAIRLRSAPKHARAAEPRVLAMGRPAAAPPGDDGCVTVLLLRGQERQSEGSECAPSAG